MGYNYQIVGKLPELKVIDVVAYLDNWIFRSPKSDVVDSYLARIAVANLNGANIHGMSLETSFSQN